MYLWMLAVKKCSFRHAQLSLAPQQGPFILYSVWFLILVHKKRKKKEKEKFEQDILKYKFMSIMFCSSEYILSYSWRWMSALVYFLLRFWQKSISIVFIVRGGSFDSDFLEVV